jgi:hypothetical protein
MQVFVHDDMQTFLVPLNERWFLVWVKRADIPNPEWVAKDIGSLPPSCF